MSEQNISILGLSFEEMEDLLAGDSLAKHHAKQLWRKIHYNHATNLSEHSLSPPLQRWCAENIGDGKRLFIEQLTEHQEIHSEDGLTRKYLLRLSDGQVIETVLMGYEGRFTACLSSQAGCAMSCVFCATGQMGFVRHLTVAEMVAQVNHVRRALSQSHPERRLRNIVLMGMGEPLHNYDTVMKAMEIVSDVRGASVGQSHISISTVGYVPRILQMAEENRPYRLAVSLHGSTEAERSALVPASKKWNLEMLIEACRTYCQKTGQKIFFEWTLIAGKNDSPETAKRLAELLQGINSHINIIPLNATDGYEGLASESGKEFQNIIRASGIPCTFRQRRGIDVAAGCGMLKAAKLKKDRNITYEAEPPAIAKSL